MSQITIQEIRKLVLSLDTLLEIVLEFDRASGGSLWRGNIEQARILDGKETGLAIAVRAPSGTTVEQRKFDFAALAAAIIHYCRKVRIPLPREGAKTLGVVPGGLEFTIEVTMLLPSRYNSAPIRESASQPAPAE